MINISHEDWTQEDFELVIQTFDDTSSPRMFVFDVDCTLVGAFREQEQMFNVRPGAVDILTALHAQGHQVLLWSAAGMRHCQEIVTQLHLEKVVSGCHSKPPFPIALHRRKVVETFGRFPDVTVDDDESECFSGVIFVKVSTFWGDI